MKPGHDTGELVELGFEDPRDSNRVVVEWLLASVCNYRCSYCPDELHDGRMRWPLWNFVEPFCRRVVEHYRSRDITFLLTGGEPTLYPRLFDLADLLHELGAAVAVLSNGSRRIEWWQRAVGRLDEAILSYHPEFAALNRFTEVVQLLAPRIPVQVNVVMTPERFDDGLAAAAAIEQVPGNVVVHRKPLMDNWTGVHSYDDQQRLRLMDANGVGGGRSPVPAGTLLKGHIVGRGSGGGARRVAPIELIVQGTNRWRGWTCSVGRDTLFVRGGAVYRAACRVGGQIGWMVDEELPLPTEPVRCTRDSCTCIAGIKSAKRADEATGQPVQVRPGSQVVPSAAVGW